MFKRKQTPPPPQPSAPINRDIYLRETNNIIDQLLHVKPTYIGEYPQAENWIKDSLENLRETVLAVDFNNLTTMEEAQLGYLLTHDLTNIFNRVISDNQRKSLAWSSLSDRICGKAEKIRRATLDLCLNQQARARSQAINIDPGATWQQLETGGQASGENEAITRVTFPPFTTADANLQTAYNLLRDTWAQAGLKDLGAEDAYIITAIASDYLPDSIRIYQRLTNRSPLAAEQGAQLLTEQLNLMRTQVETVLSHDTSDALNEMRAQSRFLTGKTTLTADGI